MTSNRCLLLLLLLLLFLIFWLSATEATNCPKECKSYVSLSNLSGEMDIGPAAFLQWKAIPFEYPPNSCVESVKLNLNIASDEQFEFLLNVTHPTASKDFFFGTQPLHTNGSVSFLLDTGCDDPSNDYKSPWGVPQIRIDYQGTSDGLDGGLDGSVIFNSNLPETNNSLILGDDVILLYTACIDDEDGFSELHNATVWVQFLGSFIGAAYLDLFSSERSMFETEGSVWGPNATIVFDYLSTGVLFNATTCINRFNCYHNAFELFSTDDCPANT